LRRGMSAIALLPFFLAVAPARRGNAPGMDDPGSLGLCEATGPNCNDGVGRGSACPGYPRNL
jgi:hypothetical protein